MANAQGTEILSPLGRYVQGNVWELQDQYEDDGKTIKKDDKGQTVQRCYFAIAVPKDSPEWMPFWNQLMMVASSGYPQYFNNGQCPDLRSFAWKVTDGDGFDKYGKPNNQKQGFAGCWIVKFSSSFLPRCYLKGKYQRHEQLQDRNTIKPGFFIRVGLIARPNIGSKTHGLYLSADMLQLEFVGEEIITGRDAGAAFGAQQQSNYVPPGAQQLPAGGMAPNAGNASMMLGGGNGAGMSPMGGMPGNMQQQPNGGMMPGGAAMPGTNVQPQNGFAAGAINGGGMPQGNGMQGGASMSGSPAGMNPGMPMAGAMGAQQGNAGFPFNQQQQRQLVPTPKANGYTLDQFYANGFDEARVVAEGFFTYA